MSAERFAEFLFARRVLIACVLIALTAIAALFATRVTVENSVEIWFLEDDPDLLTYNAFTERFQFDESVIIVLFGEDIFEPETLAVVDGITRAAATTLFVDHVLSITNSASLAREEATDPRAFRAAVLGDSILNGTFVTPDGRGTAIIVQVSREGNELGNKRALVAALQTIVAEWTAATPLTVRMSGTPVIDDKTMRNSQRDLTRMVPPIIAITLLIPLLIFRNVVLTLVPLVVVSMATIWAYGFMGLVGWRVTLASVLLVPLILVVGVADSIHLLSRYVRELGSGRSHERCIEAALSRLLKPCCFTTATTVAGLLSLSVGRLQPIREFAVTASVGVIAALVVTLGLIPAALGSLRNHEKLMQSTDTGLTRVLHLPRRSAPLILIVAAGLVTFFIASAQRLQVGVDPMSWFPEDDPVRIDTEEIDAALAGSVSFEFLVSTAEGGFLEPENLRRLDEFQRWLEEETPVTRVISVIDILGQAIRVALPGAPELPATPLVAGMLMTEIGQRRDLSQWVDEDYSTGRLSGRAPLSRATEIIHAVPSIEAEIAARFPDESLRVELTGYAKLMVKMEQYVIANQINSLAVAFVVITLVMMILLRSWRLALFGVIPNLAPVAIGLGAMPLLGIGLNPGTVMVGAIALGIVVDDTVHFLVAYVEQANRGSDVEASLRYALERVGRPVLITSVVLAAGFAVMLSASFVPSQQIGIVTVIIVSAALLADLFVLPAILRVAARLQMLPYATAR